MSFLGIDNTKNVQIDATSNQWEESPQWRSSSSICPTMRHLSSSCSHNANKTGARMDSGYQMPTKRTPAYKTLAAARFYLISLSVSNSTLSNIPKPPKTAKPSSLERPHPPVSTHLRRILYLAQLFNSCTTVPYMWFSYWLCTHPSVHFPHLSPHHISFRSSSKTPQFRWLSGNELGWNQFIRVCTDGYHDTHAARLQCGMETLRNHHRLLQVLWMKQDAR